MAGVFASGVPGFPRVDHHSRSAGDRLYPAYYLGSIDRSDPVPGSADRDSAGLFYRGGSGRISASLGSPADCEYGLYQSAYYTSAGKCGAFPEIYLHFLVMVFCAAAVSDAFVSCAVRRSGPAGVGRISEMEGKRGVKAEERSACQS